MSGPSSPNNYGIAVSPSPQLIADVEYFSHKTVSLDITNLLPHQILLEDVTLQFQVDTGSAPIYADHSCGIELPATELVSLAIPVTPTCRYLENTNMFQVMAHYRINEGGRLGPRISEPHQGSYLIIKKPKDVLADVFISFKQPEYVALARLLERYARRAGLNPYLIVEDKQPGGRHWERIEEAIKRSKSAFIVWGERTEWGMGVQREIELCRKHGVMEVLLLEHHLVVPDLFQTTAADVEYSRFSVDDPAESFSVAVASARARFENGSS